MILGVIWKQGSNGLPITHNQSRELAAIDASTGVLDICGQRNAFARKYSILIKELQRKLVRDMTTPSSSIATPISPQTSSSYGNPGIGLYRSPTESDSMRDNQDPGNSVEGKSVSTSPWPNPDMNRDHRSSVDSPNLSFNSPWSEQFGIFYPAGDVLSYGTINLLLHLYFILRFCLLITRLIS